jgi:hypothetical protein
MIYLDSKMSGYDLDYIGFPSVETCMAIVFESANWLVGWHATSGRDSFSHSAAKFGRYVARVGGNAPVVRVYGVTHGHRASLTDVSSELRTAAGTIAFHGPISCVMLDGQVGEFVGFRRVGGGAMCKIEYATNGKVTYVKAEVVPSKSRHRTVHPTSADALPQPLYGGDENSAPIVERVVLVNPKKGLHLVKASRIVSFDV